ncbi:MAG: histidine phosphatase family protein [Rhodospirillaceae bacterium]
MKIVHLLRHAKSDWGDLSLSDHERPLNKRGIEAAKAMGRRLAAEDFQVDAVFCSTARRARETLELLGRPFRKVPAVFTDTLYMVSEQDLFDFIKRAPETAQSILIVGHNPTTQDAALALIGRAAPGQAQALAKLKEKYPTCALTSIRFNAATAWRNVAPGTGTLAGFLRPRDLAHTPPAKKAAQKKKTKRSPRR